MEYGALVKDWLLQESKRSISLTYSALARSVGAVRLSTRGYQGYLSPLQHTIGNFVMDLRLDASVVRELGEISKTHNHLQIYHLPTDEPVNSPELLVAGGFVERYALELFGSEKPVINVLREVDPDLEIIRAEDFHVRFRTMELVAAEFLPRATANSRNHMVEATAKARELDLYNLMVCGRWVGSFMVAEFGDCIGLYNLCITAKLRRHGYGSASVQFVARRALESNKAMVLQCNEALRRWYVEFGFTEIGRMQTYSLSNSQTSL